MTTRIIWTLSLCFALFACDDGDSGGDDPPAADAAVDGMVEDPQALACDAEPVIRTTPDGVDFVRTPDSCFDNLPDWPYAPQYVEIDGLRQAYVDEGPRDGPVVLLLHGQPSWSYLYRKMIPVFVDAGYRVIAMDHVGMGRSDKPVDITAYSYLGHYDRLVAFIEALALRDINLFVQDWGSLIGLRAAGLHPEWFARVAVGDGTLPVVPAGFQPQPPVEMPDVPADIPFALEELPAQQPLLYDGCELLVDDPLGGFDTWMTYAMRSTRFRPSVILEALTWFDLPAAEEAAYDAPFPSRIYMGGPRTFPSLINELGGQNDTAWTGLTQFERPFLTVWAANDPGGLGQCATQEQLIRSVPGAAGWPHPRLPEASHFLQDDQGARIARLLLNSFEGVPHGRGARYCELLIVSRTDAGLEAKVWGTPSLNTCPQEALDALDLMAIQAAEGAVAVVMNGPRHWIPNRTVGSLAGGDVRQTFGEIEMRQLAVVELGGAPMEQTPYTEMTVRRTTRYTYYGGEEVYTLTAPDGATYVMQSMSLMSDPSLQFSDLTTLDERLSLPDGWAYAVTTLEEDLVLSAPGEATVLTDDLGNTYQRQ